MSIIMNENMDTIKEGEQRCCEKMKTGCKTIKWHLITVEPVMFLFAFASGFTIIANQAMLYRKVCLNMHSYNICDHLNATENEDYLTEVQKATSKWFSYQNMMYSLPVLITVALYGSWSDNFSRKIPLLIVPIATLLATVNDLINAVYIEADPAFLLIGYFIYGLAGGYTTLNLAVFSYMSEATKQESRTLRISIVSAFPNMAYIVSAIASGNAIAHFGFVPGYVIAIICHLLTILYIMINIKDIRPESRRQDIQSDDDNGIVCVLDSPVPFKHLPFKRKLQEIFSFKHFKESVLVTFQRRGGRIRLSIILCVGIAFTNNVTSALGTFYLYFNYPPLSLGPALYGYYNAWGAFIYGSSQLVAIPVLKSRFHILDSVLAITGVASDLLSRVWFGVCRQNWMLFLVPFTAYMWPAITTSVRAMVATLVRPDEFGKISAVIAWLESLSTLIATLLFANLLYPATIEIYSGMVYFISAALCTIPLVMAIKLHGLLKTETAHILIEHEVDGTTDPPTPAERQADGESSNDYDTIDKQ